MNRRDFLKTSAAVAASSAVLGDTKAFATGPIAAYERPLHIVWANQGGVMFPSYSQTKFVNAFAQVSGGVTSMTPFFLNASSSDIATPTYQAMIAAVQGAGTTIVPGFGSPNRAFDDPANKAIAAGYATFTNYIRFENVQTLYDSTGGPTALNNMLSYLVSTLGFDHIMLNSWPKDSSGNSVVFSGFPQVDASFNQVQYNNSNPSDPTNWQVNTVNIGKILTAKSSCRIIVNYESAPEHIQLTNDELATPGKSKTDMQVTVTQIQGLPASDNASWAPPFTQNYDPFALGTWNWIANHLSLF